MTTKSKLAIIPEGYKVVPEEVTLEFRAELSTLGVTKQQYIQAVKAAPQLDTPPVLRWEDGSLLLGEWSVTWVGNDDDGTGWYYVGEDGRGVGDYATEQEARRAAEKALGFPDGLVIDESN